MSFLSQTSHTSILKILKHPLFFEGEGRMISWYIYKRLANRATSWKICSAIVNQVNEIFFCPTVTYFTEDQNEKNGWGQTNLIKVQIFWEGHKHLKKISHISLFHLLFTEISVVRPYYRNLCAPHYRKISVKSRWNKLCLDVTN